MKKIDLHIHTKASEKEKAFNFSIDKLKEYIKRLDIDCIAITNHNLFDVTQFSSICNELNIYVLPGIEINLGMGHLLLIGENKDLEDFSEKCSQIESHLKIHENLSVGELKRIFVNLNNYLLIPHYDKNPKISREIIDELKEHLSSGEVSSIKKFLTCLKDKDNLVPLLFSDLRISDDIDEFSTRQTYLDLQEISLRGIKLCLSDKFKVFLSKEKANNLFQATDDGLMLSTGLNVILGERSSGKTYTLNKISNLFGNVKYIKQFSLLQNDEEQLSNYLVKTLSVVSESYLVEFKKLLEEAVSIDTKQNETEIEKYLETLHKYASESEKADYYSKSALFSETPYSVINDFTGLQELINGIEKLINNSEYREIIEKHIPKEKLKSLIIDLMREYTVLKEADLKKKWINGLVKSVKDILRIKTTSTFIEDADFFRILLDKKKINIFEKVVNYLKVSKVIFNQELKGFKIVAETKKYSGAQELKNKSHRKISFADAYNNYTNPYDFLQQLKKIDIAPTEYHQYFIDIDDKIVNKYGFQVSGGERSEFILLNEIADALQYEMLLIDEPESSFDNTFLKNNVNEIIKDISREIPVVVVTHNNTVGASIKPDYLAVTQKSVVNGEIKYSIYSGYPSDKQLKNTKGESIENYDVLLNCLEAGEATYQDRRINLYEILKS